MRTGSTFRITLILVACIVVMPFAGFLLYNSISKTNLPYLGPENHIVPAFSFINQNGTQTNSDEFRNKIVVADFFFTRCPGICLKMTSQLKRVQESYKDSKDVKILSFSVDPERDSVETLAAYAQQFDVDSSQWTLMTGDKKEIYKLARNGFFVSALEGDGGPDDFIHSEKLVLVDRNGKIRGYYDGTDAGSVDRLIGDIEILLKKY